MEPYILLPGNVDCAGAALYASVIDEAWAGAGGGGGTSFIFEDAGGAGATKKYP